MFKDYTDCCKNFRHFTNFRQKPDGPFAEQKKVRTCAIFLILMFRLEFCFKNLKSSRKTSTPYRTRNYNSRSISTYRAQKTNPLPECPLQWPQTFSRVVFWPLIWRFGRVCRDSNNIACHSQAIVGPASPQNVVFWGVAQMDRALWSSSSNHYLTMISAHRWRFFHHVVGKRIHRLK